MLFKTRKFLRMKINIIDKNNLNIYSFGIYDQMNFNYKTLSKFLKDLQEKSHWIEESKFYLNISFSLIKLVFNTLFETIYL